MVHLVIVTETRVWNVKKKRMAIQNVSSFKACVFSMLQTPCFDLWKNMSGYTISYGVVDKVFAQVQIHIYRCHCHKQRFREEDDEVLNMSFESRTPKPPGTLSRFEFHLLVRSSCSLHNNFWKPVRYRKELQSYGQLRPQLPRRLAEKILNTSPLNLDKISQKLWHFLQRPQKTFGFQIQIHYICRSFPEVDLQYQWLDFFVHLGIPIYPLCLASRARQRFCGIQLLWDPRPVDGETWLEVYLPPRLNMW